MTKEEIAALKIKLQKLVKGEYYTDPGWTGKSVEVDRGDNNPEAYAASAQTREAVNSIGAAHGCHQCLTHVEVDENQTWIGDHIPPTALDGTNAEKAVVKTCGLPERRLLPQCQGCMRKQPAVVAQVKSMSQAEMVEWLKRNAKTVDGRMIFGGWGTKTSGKDQTWVETSGAEVTATQSAKIQPIGKMLGCHSCGQTRYPASSYIADHVFPAELGKTWAEKAFALIGVAYPRNIGFRPHCPLCSSKQGGARWDGIIDAVAAYAAENNVVDYSGTMKSAAARYEKKKDASDSKMDTK